MRKCSFNQKLDSFIIEYVEVVAIDWRYAAGPVAHIFAQTDISDYDETRALCFDGLLTILNDPVFCVCTACLFVFFLGNSKKQDRLQADILGALGVIDNFLQGKLKNARHARDRLPPLQFFAYKKRQDEIIWA